MEAILEATARDSFGKNEARRTRRERPGAGGAVRRDGEGGNRDGDADCGRARRRC